jgi:SecD/SecF fusion protein
MLTRSNKCIFRIQMKKQKRWQLAVIIATITLTIYNILPTVFFYAQPLKSTISAGKAKQVSEAIAQRVNSLEPESVEWIGSFNKAIGIKSSSIKVDLDHPSMIHITFNNEDDASKFREFLPKAGALIPFVPAQLTLAPTQEISKEVVVQRAIPIQFDERNLSDYFTYSAKRESDGSIAPLYKKVILDRISELAMATGGPSENAKFLDAVIHAKGDSRADEYLMILAQNINSYAKTLGKETPLAKRFYSTFTQGNFNSTEAASSLLSSLNELKDRTRVERIQLENKEKSLKADNSFLESSELQELDTLRTREIRLSKASSIVKENLNIFSAGNTPFTEDSLDQELAASGEQIRENIQLLNVAKKNPIISEINIDWETEKVTLVLQNSIVSKRASLEGTPRARDGLDQIIFNEIARISRMCGESISPMLGNFEIELNALTDSKSFLVMELASIAEQQANQIKDLIRREWNPTHKDLSRKNFPIWDSKTYETLSANERALGLVVYAPAAEDKHPEQGFRMGSVYVVAKGIDQILKKLEANPNSPQAQAFMDDFSALRDILKQNNFYGYPGTTYPLSSAFSKDFIFEAEDSYQSILKATREDFHAYGTKKYGILEFTNVEQRLLASNKIDDQIHEDLLKWKDEFNAAQVDPDKMKIFEVPAPTSSPLWSNFKLSLKKYFRGDERKILHWGLDLAGGKTVQIELRDNNNKIVKDESDIKQGINELYARVNKMGVSEVSIRQEGSNITLDFPGAQGFSASELVKASSMYFHIVNEQFGQGNKHLAEASSRFLQDIWNEAVVTGRKDAESINLIAWNHLYGDSSDGASAQPRSDSAKMLYDNGLRLAHPQESTLSSSFNDSVSRIALFRGDNFNEWQGQANPLLIVFSNYALEGSNLENVHASYDPSKGNFLSFEVRSSQTLKNGMKTSPRAELFTWTNTFSKEKVVGTPLENHSAGRGWRMAVVLNNSVISAPTLDSALRDSAMISGSFTQREANKLESDLKAGSLTFAPKILSEKNVSPELGQKDRMLGIIATIVALCLVIALMTAYYRFSGLIASIAVIFNLLIMWATLQNMHATMTLAGIAAIILTMGMAVDANVLVFERIREEFKKTGKIVPSVQAGYKKAFSAIIDSNVTTIIAAIILLNFDSGPIKGFALIMIIGIVSSMFTALFMTRYFFSKWVENPKHKSLKMSEFVKASGFNFLKYGKTVMTTSLVIIVVGSIFMAKDRERVMGMDFTGGFALNVELEQSAAGNYRSGVEKALISAGASAQDFQIRELTPANHVRIFFGKVMEQSGNPFHGLPLEKVNQGAQYGYENNPRIMWVTDALDSAGITLTEKAKTSLDKNWTSVSGQMSDAMRNNSLIGLAIALLCIFVYITIRFEFKYAISATIALIHDVCVTVGLIALLNAIGVPVQIDLNTIAALMTIVGYSLNDTIVIFDRIREDVKLRRKGSFKDLINNALNVTLSRTVMTSATTFIVLVALVTLGGSSIFGFALVMSLGVVIGTLSSLFVAAPIMHLFHRREVKQISANGEAKT